MILKNKNPYFGPSFSILNRIYRFIWNLFNILFFDLLPFKALRVFVLRLFGSKIGKNVNFYGGVKVWSPKNLIMGSNIGVGKNVNLYSMDKIYIGDFCTISQNSYICCGSHDYNSRNFDLTTAPIIINDYVWICADVFVCPNITIAEGCVIGARSKVSKSVNEKWTVYEGSPLQKIKNRKIIKFTSK